MKSIQIAVCFLAAGLFFSPSDWAEPSREIYVCGTAPNFKVAMEKAAKWPAINRLVITGATDQVVNALPYTDRVSSLAVSSSRLTGSGIESISHWPRLRSLLMTDKTVSRDVMQNLSKLNNLEELYLESADLSDEDLISLSSLPKLKILDISNSGRFTNVGIRALARLPQLEALRCLTLGRRATPECMDSFGPQSKLSSLRIPDRNADAWLAHTRQLPLQALFLATTDMTDGGLKFVPRRSLRHLLLPESCSSNALSRLEPCPNLEFLRLSRCQVTNAALSHVFAICPKLQELELCQTRVHMGDLHISEQCNLRKLDLKQTPTSDRDVNTLVADFPGLESLSLFGTNITDRSIERLSDLQQLRVLEVGDTKLSGNAAAVLKKMPHLQEVSVPVMNDNAIASLMDSKSIRRIYVFGRISERLMDLARTRQKFIDGQHEENP